MSEPKRRRFQFSLRMLLMAVAACALGIGLAEFFFSRYLFGPLKDSYAAVQLAAMINAYLDAHGCAWPRNWDDLRDYYAVNGTVRGSSYCSFAEVRDCWIVDFDADPAELAGARPRVPEPPFRALRQRHHRRMAHPQSEPNLRIHWRLRAHAGLQTAAMIIEYLKANPDAWPTSWDDLRKYYHLAVKEEGGHYCSLKQARDCMAVDFDADPAEFARVESSLSERPFCVVYPRYPYPGEDPTSPGPWNPNQRILDYLKSRKPQQTADDRKH